MLEKVRMHANTLLKASLADVKKNTAFWNGLHGIGLNPLVDRLDVAVWGAGNAIVAARQMDADTTEIYLIIGQRQPGYVWVNGFYPDEQAAASWNRLRKLWLEAHWVNGGIHLCEEQRRVVPRDVELLWTAPKPVDDRTLRAWVESHPRDLFVVKGDVPSAIEKRTRELRKHIEWAKAFKREQDATADLTVEQMATGFLEMLPSSEQPHSIAESADQRNTDIGVESNEAISFNRDEFTREKATMEKKLPAEELGEFKAETTFDKLFQIVYEYLLVHASDSIETPQGKIEGVCLVDRRSKETDSQAIGLFGSIWTHESKDEREVNQRSCDLWVGKLKVAPVNDTEIILRVIVIQPEARDFVNSIGRYLFRTTAIPDALANSVPSEWLERPRGASVNTADSENESKRSGEATTDMSSTDDQLPRKRRRPISMEKRQEVKKIMEKWLEDKRDLSALAGPGHGSPDAKTVRKYIESVLDSLDEQQRRRWIAELRSLGEQDYLGKFR